MKIVSKNKHLKNQKNKNKKQKFIHFSQNYAWVIYIMAKLSDSFVS